MIRWSKGIGEDRQEFNEKVIVLEVTGTVIKKVLDRIERIRRRSMGEGRRGGMGCRRKRRKEDRNE